MKVKSLASLALLAISLPTFADRIMVTGEPVELTPEGDYYVYTDTAPVTTTTTYHYVNVGGEKKVCYASRQRHGVLAKVTPTGYVVKTNGKKVNWSCYPYEETYFEVR